MECLSDTDFSALLEARMLESDKALAKSYTVSDEARKKQKKISSKRGGKFDAIRDLEGAQGFLAMVALATL